MAHFKTAIAGAAAATIGAVGVTAVPPIIQRMLQQPDPAPHRANMNYGDIEVWLDPNGHDVWYGERGSKYKLADSDVGVPDLRSYLQDIGAIGEDNRHRLNDSLLLVGGGGCAFTWSQLDPRQSELWKDKDRDRQSQTRSTGPTDDLGTLSNGGVPSIPNERKQDTVLPPNTQKVE